MGKKSYTSFNKILLGYIYHNDTVELKKILNHELVQACDDFGTLLHHAAEGSDPVISQILIRCGAKVDRLGQDNKTPLILAIEARRSKTVKVLLEANASIDVIETGAKSALLVALDLRYFEHNVVRAFASKLEAENCTTEKLAERLIAAGCNMHHATVLSDINLMKCMLDHGIEIDSKGSGGNTALFVAVFRNNFKLVEWLVKNGADVNILDDDEESALAVSSGYGNKDIIKILLEQGADPNCKDSIHLSTPMFALFSNSNVNEKEFVDCVELLLQHGAIPQNVPYDHLTLFDYALYGEDDVIIKILVCHLAILEMAGTSTTESVIRCEDPANESKVAEIKDFYELCLELLKNAVFEELSLFNLLQANEDRMKLLVRNQTFVSEVEDFCSKHRLSESYSYYYKKIMKSITKANRMVKLENEAIPVISKIFNRDRDLCYYCSRKIISYLNERDLENLLLM